MLKPAGRAAAVLLALAACARIEPPPGGPPDTKPPKLISIRPDSNAVLPGFDGEIEFVFDEVVSEGGQPSEGFGTGDLEKLVLLSPTTGVPRVNWRRNRITVRPREGWRPNTVYRMQLLPGVSDIRSNRPEGQGAGTVLTFTTGAPLPDFVLTGKVYDWSTAQPARGALLEAVLEPDSLVYRAATDSSGGYRFGPLPRGRYLLYATVDQNRNGRRDRREAFDSSRVAGDSGAVPELWMFVHDTAPPRAQTAAAADSLTIALQFNQKLDPALRLDTTSITVLRLPDSVRVPVVSVLPPAQHDSLYRRAAGRPDSAGAGRAGPRDSAAAPAKGAPGVKAPGAMPKGKVPDAAPGARAPAATPDSQARAVPPAAKPPAGGAAPPAAAKQPGAPALRPAPDSGKAAIARLDSLLPRSRDSTRAARPGRPALNDRLMIRLAEPLVPGGRYAIDVRGARNVSGVAGDSRAGLTVAERPKVRPADSLRADSLRRDSLTRDSLRALPDSLRRAADSAAVVPDSGLPPQAPAPPDPTPTRRDTLAPDPRRQAAPRR